LASEKALRAHFGPQNWSSKPQSASKYGKEGKRTPTVAWRPIFGSKNGRIRAESGVFLDILSCHIRWLAWSDPAVMAFGAAGPWSRTAGAGARLVLPAAQRGPRTHRGRARIPAATVIRPARGAGHPPDEHLRADRRVRALGGRRRCRSPARWHPANPRPHTVIGTLRGRTKAGY